MTQEQYAQMYETYYMRVFSYAMTLSGDRIQAEEITQEAFFRALSKQSTFRGEADEVTWLCSIAKNLFVDEKRRQGRHEEISEEIPDEGKGMEQTAEDRDSSFRIHLALHDLEEPYREVFTLRTLGQLSFRDIGELFGKSENWACVVFHRARTKIKEKMEE